MDKIIIAGIGTEVGKTVVAAIMATIFKGDYWKPVQSGQENYDTKVIEKLLDSSKHCVFPSSYSFKAPISPHHAALLENISIYTQKITPPKTNRPLIIEMVGGIYVPFSQDILSIDIFQSWKAKWVIVSKNYLGSINHTLLTTETLKSRKIQLLGIVFNGQPNLNSEKDILKFSKIPIIGRIFPEKLITASTIKRYAKAWKQSGILSLK